MGTERTWGENSVQIRAAQRSEFDAANCVVSCGVVWCGVVSPVRIRCRPPSHSAGLTVSGPWTH
jgi:hypothetical protein